VASPSDESILRHVLNRRMVICALAGFSSGLPLFVLIQLLPGWLRSQGVGLKEIGFFALVQLPYIWKFLWSPLLDRYTLPWLGRRRGWMIVAQVCLFATIVLLGQGQPTTDLRTVMVLAVVVAFFSATQDIVLDAYRRELLPDVELGIGNAVFVQTYRISGLVPGTLGFVLAGQNMPWDWVFAVVAAFMLVGIGLTLYIGEAVVHPSPPKSLREAIVEPFREFVTRRGWKYALLALAFMFFYKLGDSMATALSTPFYIDLGFSLTQIGLIAKNAALWPSIIGGLLGGVLMVRIGINRSLWVFGVIQWVTILGFALLAQIGNNPWALAIAISLEYLGVGLGTTAFVAFIARETTPMLAATQFALFTALTAVPRTVANAITGFLVEGNSGDHADGVATSFMNVLMMLGVPADGLGWTRFFLLCMVLAVPGMLLLFWVAPYPRKAASGLPTEAP
jgi:PAT family beta-lactamase induction signal transducer AmpG